MIQDELGQREIHFLSEDEMPLEEILGVCIEKAFQTALESLFLHFGPRVPEFLNLKPKQELKHLIYWKRSFLWMAVERLYESENFIIVNKPYDMYINSDDENEKNTVTYHIAQHDSHLSTSTQPLHFVQRLDYATSGVLCIAKNKSAAARAGKLFEGRLTRKYYLAVVRGHLGFELGDINYEVGVDPLTQQSSHRMLAVTKKSSLCETSREAQTRLLALESGFYGSDPATVVILKPITGRRHQLRVHCQSIGHTILGDYTYSDTKDSTPHRMFLHAIRLVLPLHGEPLDIQTSEPFFSDKRFQSQWKSVDIFNKYRTKEAFRAACDVIDRPYVIGVKYQSYSSND